MDGERGERLRWGRWIGDGARKGGWRGWRTRGERECDGVWGMGGEGASPSQKQKNKQHPILFLVVALRFFLRVGGAGAVKGNGGREKRMGEGIEGGRALGGGDGTGGGEVAG